MDMTPLCNGMNSSFFQNHNWLRPVNIFSVTQRRPIQCTEYLIALKGRRFIPGGGGYSVWKRVPGAVRPPRSCGCRDPRWLKKGGCPLIIFYKRRGGGGGGGGGCQSLCIQYSTSNNNCMHSNLFVKPFKTIVW